MPALPVNEIFESVQGEGSFTGEPSAFIRLQGCDVGCPWCDTKHTWASNTSRVSQSVMLGKEQDSDQFALWEVADLAAYIAKLRSRHVVVTGGEPCMHDLRLLCEALIAEGKSVQIETSGTYPIRAPIGAFVTLSPKFDMPGKREVLYECLARANEIKMPVGKQEDVDNLVEWLHRHRSGHYRRVYLQPLSCSPKATQLCIVAARQHRWRLSVQVHKFIGVR